MQRLGAEVSVSVWKYNRAHPRQPCVTMRAEVLQVDRRKDEAIRPYHFAWASKLPFLGYERPWNAGYGSVSSARGWLTVIGRSAFRDDSTAN